MASEKLALEWQFDRRLIAEHLGARKYSSLARAFGELVANSLDAGAQLVEIRFELNAIDGVSSVAVVDNGRGITVDELRTRFLVVGVQPNDGGRLGRLGVGRLAVHRIGRKSNWTSVSRPAQGPGTQLRFSLASEPSSTMDVEVTEADGSPTGTRVDIYDLLEGHAPPSPLFFGKLRTDLTGQFCGYLLAHGDRKVIVQGDTLEVRELIESQESEALAIQGDPAVTATITHLILSRPLDATRSVGQLLFAAGGQTLHTDVLDDAFLHNYMAVVECPQLSELVTSNRESLLTFDPLLTRVRTATIDNVRAFADRYRARLRSSFIERARKLSYYPYRNPATGAVATAQQEVYDVVLEAVNKHANVEAMSQKQQAVVFRLLARALANENLLEILGEVASLSDEDITRFRRVLERTTLTSIIKLSSEVTARLHFLDVLHELVYGESAKLVKERSQLHKILEPHCWIFGAQYHLATSDKAFREVVRRHRGLAGLEPCPDETLMAAKALSDVPDLFLAAQRDYPAEPKHHHLLVELKAPGVSLGSKERDQIHRYASTIRNTAELDKRSTRWDLFLVSAKLTDEIDADRRQKDRPFGVLYQWDSITVSAFQWSEIISQAREELRLVREHLDMKSAELGISKYLREEYPELLGLVTGLP